jgi:NADPH2:quinone reductase
MQSWWMQIAKTDPTLELRDSPIPIAGPTQLLVRLRAASLNRGEFLPGHGAVGSWKSIGGEGAGEVVTTGRDVDGFRTGDRVMGRCAAAFSEYALIEATEAIPMPDKLSWEQGAAIPLTFLVSFEMLVLKGQINPGDWVLINGVSCGVGVASLQLAKARGAKVIGTSGSAEKLASLQPLGLDLGLCTRGPDFAAAVMHATGQQGANLIINTVGGTVFTENIRSLAFEGRLATVGYVDGVVHAEIDLEALHTKRLTVFGVSNRLRSKEQRAAAVPRFISEIMPLIASGSILPQIDQVLDFSDVPRAKARMEAAGHVGKIVVRMPPIR